MMMEFVHNRSFTLITGRGNERGLRRLKTAFFRTLFWHPLHLYIHNLPPITSRLYANAVGLALVHPAVEWSSLERKLKQLDMTSLSSYLQK